VKPVRLGIIANTGKSVVAEVLPPFFTWLKSSEIPFIVSSDLMNLIDLSDCEAVSPEAVAGSVDFVLSFGGDGTFLRTAHLIAPSQVPIIGINLGAFGYLAEVGVDQLRDRITDLLYNRFLIQDRFMLEASINVNSKAYNFHALNDIVLDKCEFPRLIRLETSIDGEYLNIFNADGLIVSTPTGSTGYSLSVGGPITEPEVDAMIISPINPHMLANRPLVVSGKRTVEISTFSEAGSFQIITDGQSVLKPASGEKVTIKRSSRITRLVKFGDYTFYSLLRNKLHWRDQLNQKKGLSAKDNDL